MFNDFIACYLFLGGAGAGTCVVLTCLSAANLLSSPSVKDFPQVKSVVLRRFFGFGFLLVAVICLVGALCLLLDLARPDKVITLLFSPTITVVSVGAYTLVAVIFLSSLLGLTWLGVLRPPRWLVYLLSGIIVFLSFVLMTYTAVLLQIISRIALFQSEWLVVLFLSSSLSCGTAFTIFIAAIVRAYDPLLAQLRKILIVDFVLIVIEILSLAAFLFFAKPGAEGAVMALMQGPLAMPFWFGLVVCGLVVPAVCLLKEMRFSASLPSSLIPAALIAIGGFLLRWCILKAAIF